MPALVVITFELLPFFRSAKGFAFGISFALPTLVIGKSSEFSFVWRRNFPLGKLSGLTVVDDDSLDL